jgi:CRISPR/Cas system endoribonuclease Cas6 (RAMP superfamily)
VVVSYFVFAPSIVPYPTNQIADFIYQNNKQGGNVAFFSDNEPLYSSSVMWYVRTMDESRGIRFYRSCVFDQKNETEILSIMKDNNIYFVIYSSWSENKNIDKIKDRLDLKLEVGGSEYKTLVYTFKDFEYKKIDKCNFICLTKEVICTV